MPRGLSMSVGELLERLAQLPDDLWLQGLHPDCEIGSYRGFYEDIAIATGAGCTVRLLSDVLREAVGQRFEGYKGGGARCSLETGVWIADWGETGLDIGAVNADGTFERMFQGAEKEEAMTEEKLHRAIARAVRADAEKKKNDAGYSGAYHDGGAAQLLGLLEAWQAGLQGRIPAAFSDYQAQHIRDTDQEYAQYLRLRRKFEGK